MSRAAYAAMTIESAAWLVGSCTDEDQKMAILSRACQMLENVWTCEHRLANGWPGGMQSFWDEVSDLLRQGRKVYQFNAIFGEQVNPPGELGNVHVAFQPSQSVQMIILRLKLNDRISREDYDLILEKAEQ